MTLVLAVYIISHMNSSFNKLPLKFNTSFNVKVKLKCFYSQRYIVNPATSPLTKNISISRTALGSE